MKKTEGQPMFHYTECGLDNVWIRGGFVIDKTDYGETLRIFDTPGLHKAIGRCLVDSQAVLTGAEFRFLRLELELSQKQVAGLINADEQAVRRWEKERKRPVKGPGERMMRVLYHAFVTSDPIRASIERLAELDVPNQASKRFLMWDKCRHWQKDFEACSAMTTATRKKSSPRLEHAC